VLYLGFLKFLKRDKGKEPDFGSENMEDLDMPPPPPDFGGNVLGEGEKGLPELPELPEEPISEIEEKPLPDLGPSEKMPPKFKFPGMESPKLDEEPRMPELSPSEESSSRLEFPDMGGPEFKEDLEESEPSPPKPLFGMQKPRLLFGARKTEEEKHEVGLPPSKPIQEIKPYESLKTADVREERSLSRHKEAEGPIFIRVNRFRDILTDINTIKNNLNISSQSTAKLNAIDANRDKVFKKWRNVMMDLQKKLIYVDKTLFKKV
tara:strand:+ start:532 stop:1320 length:789 start_codon:yes stop_codon:yes gene_type:complete